MITKNPASRTLIIHTVGNLDALTADHYRGELRSLIAEGYRFLIFDLDETPYMNSSGLGLLVEFFNSVRRNQGAIRLINCSKQVRWLLEQTHLESLFAGQGSVNAETEVDPTLIPAFDSLHSLMSDEIRALSLINDFVLKALNQDDPHAIGQLLLAGVLKTLRADFGALLLLSEDGNYLEPVHLQQNKMTGTPPDFTKIPLASDPFATQVVAQGEALWHRLGDESDSNISIFKKLGFDCMLTAPISGTSRRFGLLVIEAADDTTDIFQAAKPLIMTFANIGGLAMEKAALRQSDRHKDEALSSSLKRVDHYRHSLDRSSRLVAMGTLTTGLTHMLNNQMVPLLGYTQLLRQSLDLSEEASRKVDCVYESVARVNKTIDKVIRLTQLNHTVFENVDIQQTIQTVIDLLQTKIEESGIDLQVNTPHQMDPVRGNAEFLKQSILAIIHRSIVTLSQTGQNGHRWIRIIISLMDNNLRIVFEDNGQNLTSTDFEEITDPIPSIDEIKLGHIFNYNIPRSLIRRHHGNLHLERRKEGGKRVILDLPASFEQEAVAKPEMDFAQSPN